MPGPSNYRPHQAWNHFYHCMANTHGTWLPGDPRGFRTRHHREHIQGDYKNPPPPGKYDEQHQRSKALLKKPPTYLSPEARQHALDAIIQAFDHHGIEVAALAITAVHLHLLARFPPTLLRSPGIAIPGLRTSALDDPPRHFLGIAKKESARALSRAKLKPAGPAWAARGKVKPVRSETHFIYLRDRYIPNHRSEGASLYPETRGL